MPLDSAGFFNAWQPSSDKAMLVVTDDLMQHVSARTDLLAGWVTSAAVMFSRKLQIAPLEVLVIPDTHVFTGHLNHFRGKIMALGHKLEFDIKENHLFSPSRPGAAEFFMSTPCRSSEILTGPYVFPTTVSTLIEEKRPFDIATITVRERGYEQTIGVTARRPHGRPNTIYVHEGPYIALRPTG